jgi:hypothetical protein
MDDRELLERAAKAIGCELLCDHSGGRVEFWIYNKGMWNPLENDGDALRLAATLGMRVGTDSPGDGRTVIVEPVRGSPYGANVTRLHAFEKIEPDGADPMPFVRRAIVRCAAGDLS